MTDQSRPTTPFSYVDDYAPPVQVQPVSSGQSSTLSASPIVPVSPSQANTPAKTGSQVKFPTADELIAEIAAEQKKMNASNNQVNKTSTPKVDFPTADELVAEIIAEQKKMNERKKESNAQAGMSNAPKIDFPTADELVAEIIAEQKKTKTPGQGNDSVGVSKSTIVPSASDEEQTLEDQNIFHLLGIEGISEKERELFLDELQQIIWEDFLERDVDLLLTEDELAQFKKISDKKFASEDDRQSEMVDFLEKLIPDLEKIMLEKALELKEEMVRERIAEALKTFANQSEKLSKVKRAQQLISQVKWKDAADELNAIS